MKILLLIPMFLIPIFSQNDYVINTSGFLENNFIIEISIDHQNLLNTKISSSFFRLNEEFKAQLSTTEFKYFNTTEINSYEYQGSVILTIIYFGMDNFIPQNIKLVFDNSEYDFSMNTDTKTEFVEKSNKYRSVCYSEIPLLLFRQFIQSKAPQIRFGGARIYKDVSIELKAQKFFFSFYNCLTGFYFDDKKYGE